MRKTNEDCFSRLRGVSELELFFQLEQMKTSNLSERKEKDAIIHEIQNRYPGIDLNAWVLNWKNYLETLSDSAFNQLALCRMQNLPLNLFNPERSWQFYSILDEVEIPMSERDEIQELENKITELDEVDLFFLTHYFSKAIGEKMEDYQNSSKRLQKALRNFNDPLVSESDNDFQTKTEAIKKKYEDFDQLVTRNHKVVDRNYSVISQMQIEKIKACYLDQIKQTEMINQLWIPLNRCLLEARRFGVPVQVKDRITGEMSTLNDTTYDQDTLNNKVVLTDEGSNVLLWYNKWREYFLHTDFTTNQEIDRIAMNQLHLDHDYLQSEEIKQKKLVS
ncbi:MAG TPA: hypothetical protein IAB56_01200 [Candidatus Scybalousia intestinigallinarum]|nr:hypothetical protein [Candidatus Scybalousia intestinigallinarum]